MYCLTKKYPKLLTCVMVFVFATLASADAKAPKEPKFKAFSKKVTGDIYSQIKVIADMDGDKKPDLIFGATDGYVHVWGSNGKEFRKTVVWPRKLSNPVMADVNVADLDHDGEPEILAATTNGELYCINKSGTFRWRHKTRGTILVSGPEVADVDGSGNLNIFIGSRAGKVCRLSGDGRLIWEIKMSSTVGARIVPADLDGDGTKEIVCKEDNGKVSVIRLSGGNYSGWPQMTSPNLTWPFNVGVTDINGDGQKEIYTTAPKNNKGYFRLWNAKGKLQNEFPLSDASHDAPRLADLNGDGRNDFIIAQADGTVVVCDRTGKVFPGWPMRTKHSIYNSPKIIDIDGDGKLDVVFTAWNPKGVGEKAGYIMALNRNGQTLKGFPKYIGKTIAPLTFADLDGDGFLEMIAAGGICYTGKQLHVFPTHAKAQIKMAVLGSDLSFDSSPF